MKIPRLATVLAALLVCGSACAHGALSKPRLLRCEYRENPVGLDRTAPRLSWVLESAERAQVQTAYQVLVASSPAGLDADSGDLWDTGKVGSDQTAQIAYTGAPLTSRARAWWKVRVWDKDGRASPWSDPATWTMGLLHPGDWQARWIADSAAATNKPTRGPHNGYHSQFAAAADTARWIAVDLGKPQRIDAVRLHPARPFDWQPDTPGFLFPLRFKIEASTRADFADAQTVGDLTQADHANPGTNAVLCEFAAVTAQHVRLAVTRLGLREGTNFAFALAELEVLRNGAVLSRGAAASALDSIETGAWGVTNIADGITATIPPGGSLAALPATMLRKSFRVDGSAKRATAYVSALGLYELRINGQRVGDQLLAPEWTSYRKRVQYQVWDVTAHLRRGENAVAALVAEGWYAGRLMAMPRFPYGTFPRFLLQLEIELDDGRVQTVVSDDAWRAHSEGPIISAGIYDGEIYDARREQPGWDEPGFDAAAWGAPAAFPLGTPALVGQPNEPIQVVKELKPTAVTQPRPGVFVFDLGQNMVGWCRLRAWGKAGQPVTLRHAEMLDERGELYTANLRGAPQIDRFIPRRDGPFVFEPRFTYHGFRFVELTGLAKPPGNDALLGRVFHSHAPEAGTFECSDAALNQLMRNIVWTQRGNLMSSPNDCPQRDERFGWMGDIQAFSQTAIFNLDLAAFITKFAQDIRDDQADDGRFPDFAPHPGDPNRSFSGAPAWGDAGTIVPFRAYENYGDTRLLEEHFDAARRWVDYIHGQNPGLVWAKGRNNDYNDWLNGDWVKQAGWPEKGGSVPKEVFATAFFAHSADTVGRMAEILGRNDDAKRYRELFARITSTFNQAFVKSNGEIEGDTQGGYALALHFNLLPDHLRPKAAARLVENIEQYQNHLSTGIQTTHRAMLELTRAGYHETAWQLLTNRTFPSWLYMIDNGATTVWERWDGFVKGRGFQDAGMNSFNHWAFGAVGEWIWRNVAGINPDPANPGYRHFYVRPQPGGGVTWARAAYNSIRGPIRVEWRTQNGEFELKVRVPPNTFATVTLPARDPADVRESGAPASAAPGVEPRPSAKGAAEFRIGSGDYHFTARR